MKAFVAVTNRDWYRYLMGRPDLDEVNFWRPMGNTPFRALQPGQPLLFKLPFPEHAIVGGGFFAHYTALPVSLAWETFGQKNGAATFELMRELIEKYRSKRNYPRGPTEDYTIGCILLSDPFFLPPDRWVAPPKDWNRPIVVGRTEDLRTPEGKALWARILAARGQSPMGNRLAATAIHESMRQQMPAGVFRIAVTDAYQRRCAITRVTALPVLQTAPIRPEHAGGVRRVANGLLLRSDLRTLFELGYVTVNPKLEVMVSRQLREQWNDGEEYYAMDGRAIARPDDRTQWPDRELLQWHNEAVFRP
jgi:putative restriction endonuclease